jgi:Mg2+ and Co2+ transporter CorA
MFLLRDGTLISIHQTPTPAFAEPILNRLRTRDTVLRTTADPSLLLESILDLVVDQAVEVVEAYQKKILKLEHDILLKPKMKSVRARACSSFLP